MEEEEENHQRGKIEISNVSIITDVVCKYAVYGLHPFILIMPMKIINFILKY
jgi:hypothetical protein